MLSEAVDRRVLAKAGEVASARGGDARKKGLIELGHHIYEFVSAVEQEAGSASGPALVELIGRHYRVRAGVFKAIGLIPPSLHAQGLALARRLSELELGLKPGKPGPPKAAKPGKKARRKPAGKRAPAEKRGPARGKPAKRKRKR